LGKEFNSIKKLFLKKVSQEVVDDLNDQEKEHLLNYQEESPFDEIDNDKLFDGAMGGSRFKNKTHMQSRLEKKTKSKGKSSLSENGKTAKEMFFSHYKNTKLIIESLILFEYYHEALSLLKRIEGQINEGLYSYYLVSLKMKLREEPEAIKNIILDQLKNNESNYYLKRYYILCLKELNEGI